MSQQSVEDELRDAIGELAGAVGSLHRAVVALDRARDAAAASGKPMTIIKVSAHRLRLS
jgi:hypothetical protein